MHTEWPSFSDIPPVSEEPISRPEGGQDLARWIWWDGSLREARKQSVHYYAHALHYGTAVFEGIRVYPTSRGPVLVRVREHMERLHATASHYHMQIPWSVDELVDGALAVTRKNRIEHGYLRPLAHFGHGLIDLRARTECPVHAFIAARGLGTFLGAGALRNGIRVTISSWRKLPHACIPTMGKASGQYANATLAMHEALDRGFDDAVMLNLDGTVNAATGANLFFLRGGVLFTNDESSSINPGITRDCVLTIARRLKIATTIRPFTREELIRADEVFVTGTAAEVTPVREIDGVKFATGKQTHAALFQQEYLKAVTGQREEHFGWLSLV